VSRTDATLDSRYVTSLGQEPPRVTRVRRLIPETGLQAAIWVIVAVCVLTPVLPLVYASVQSKPIYATGRSFTFSAYHQLFADPLFWDAAKNTAEFAAITTVCSVLLGAGFAVLCSRTDIVGRSVYSGLLVVPILLPPLGIILGWNALYGDGGYAHDFITSTLHIPFDLTSVVGMAVLGTAVGVPLTFLISRATLAGMDSSLEDAARSVGASPWRVIARVTVPMLRPALLNSGLLVFTVSIESLGIPLLLGGAQGHDFVASYLYNNWGDAITPDPPIVSAGATILLLCAVALLLLRRRLLGDEARFVSIGGRAGTTNTLRLGAVGRWAFSALVGLYLMATTFAPILALATSSVVSELTPLVPPWQLLTFDHWRAIGQGAFAVSIRNTIEIAIVGSILTTVVVALATMVAHRSKFRARASLPLLLIFPRAIPGIIIGIGFFWAFLLVNPPGNAIRNSIWGIMVALSVRAMTLAYFVISSAASTISASLDDAARASGGSWWTTVTRIVFPILRPALLVSFILVFISILNDFDPALFLVTPDHQIMGTTMLDASRQGSVGPVAALAMVQVALTVAAIFLAGRVFTTKMSGRRYA